MRNRPTFGAPSGNWFCLSPARSVGTVDRNGGIAPDPETPGYVGCAADTDSGAGGDVRGRNRFHRGQHPQRRAGRAYIGPILRPVDVERLAEQGRAARQVGFAWGRSRPAPSGTPRTGQRHAADDLPRPQQHSRGLTFRLADQVHAEVHAVREIHVGVAGRAIHDGIARGPAPERVRGGIALSGVRLNLNQPDSDQPLSGLMHDYGAQQVWRYGHRPTVEEVSGQEVRLRCCIARQRSTTIVKGGRPWPQGPAPSATSGTGRELTGCGPVARRAADTADASAAHPTSRAR